LRILVYSFQTALKNLWQARWINFLTVISISVGLLLLSAFLLITINVDSVINRWSRGFGMVVYLQDNIGNEDEEHIKTLLLQDKEILEVKYISNDEALDTLREVLSSQASVLEELEDNPLPSSFELKLKRDIINPSLVEKKAAQIRQIDGVDDVRYGEEWLSSLNTISKALSIIAIFLGGAIFIAITFITYTTIKILFYRRIDEIETMKLLGATRTFIKLPFLIEGLFIGLLSGVLSSLSLFVMHSFTSFKLIAFLPSLRALVMPLPLEGFLAIPLAGALLSLIGSFFATGRIRY
jgi:cell division transport system permease protein